VPGRHLGPYQAHTYLDFEGRKKFDKENLLNFDARENCHRPPWQENGAFFVGLEIILII